MADKLELMKRSFAMIKYSMPPRHGVTNVRVERFPRARCSQYLLLCSAPPKYHSPSPPLLRLHCKNGKLVSSPSSRLLA